MKRILSFMILTLLLCSVFYLMVKEENLVDLVVLSVIAINLTVMMMAKTMEYMRRKLSNKKIINKTLFIEIFWSQFSFFVSIMIIVYVLSYENVFSDWTILVLVVVMLITVVDYLSKYLGVKEKNKIKRLIKVKEDSIAQEFYNFYYVAVGMLLLVFLYFVILAITESFIYYQVVLIIAVLIYILQTIYMKNVIKSEEEN